MKVSDISPQTKYLSPQTNVNYVTKISHNYLHAILSKISCPELGGSCLKVRKISLCWNRSLQSLLQHGCHLSSWRGSVNLSIPTFKLATVLCWAIKTCSQLTATAKGLILESTPSCLLSHKEDGMHLEALPH